jgi:hypothetical protein
MGSKTAYPAGIIEKGWINPFMLNSNLLKLDDAEGERIPEGLPPVIDAHVHVFPPNLFSALWAWFDENAWPIRYRLSTSEIFQHLLSRGIKHVIAFQYATSPVFHSC